MNYKKMVNIKILLKLNEKNYNSSKTYLYV